MRRRHLYFVLGHLALIVPSAIVINGRTGISILDVLELMVVVAAALHAVAFIRREERGISAGRHHVRAALTTLLCLPIWFAIFLVLSMFTNENAMMLGLVYILPLSGVSSGLAAVLGLWLFSAGTSPQ